MSELVALAAAGGTAVVQAAGTDAWAQLRSRVGRLLGRGGRDQEQRVLSRLDQTAADLAGASDPAESDGLRAWHAGAWQARLEALLDSLPEDERNVMTEEISSLVAELPQANQEERNRIEISGGEFHDIVQIAGTIYGNAVNSARRVPAPGHASNERGDGDARAGDEATGAV